MSRLQLYGSAALFIVLFIGTVAGILNHAGLPSFYANGWIGAPLCLLVPNWRVS